MPIERVRKFIKRKNEEKAKRIADREKDEIEDHGYHLNITSTISKKKNIDALVRIGTKEAIEALIKNGIHQLDNKTTKETKEALIKLGEKAIKPLIYTGFSKNEVTDELQEVLMKIGGEKTTNELIRALDDVDGKVVAGSAQTLAKMNETHAIKRMINKGIHNEKWMFDKSEAVSYSVANALQNFTDRKAVPEIIKHGLSHENPKVVADCAGVLREFKDKRALPHLMKLSGKYEEALDDIVKEAIAVIQEANRGKD